MATALIAHDDCYDHVTPPGHPEQVARLDAVLGALKDMDLVRVAAPMAAEADLLRIHPQEHVDAVRAAAPSEGWRSLDADTHMSVGSLAAAYRAAGANVRAVDMVLGGEVQNAFAAVRPPGHHAERTTPMGFCLFGSVSIAAKHALDHHGLKRVAIVDFDVHHGNGTQDLCEDDARILFCSTHQMPLYPGTGHAHEDGAYGNVLNVPLPDGAGSKAFRDAMERLVLPAVDAFKPELLLISAGFDAHADDPLAGMRLVEDDFAWVTEQLCDLADRHCQGRVVSTLEGGYDLEALAASTAAHVQVLKERGA
ncbi:histone deacetylase family protein [Thalassobium sp. R2A62]|jgi:acetoin utilization deacetylase AcuC-like enzyme|uniref:histone deacetylase family protein n=1 Tax=Thalassobium sp. R2A62 TaxID=633131 RepID=UPI0001B1D5CE|nr:histone deacetylase family protein [Thalassobium sp. R2A62]EET49563.1 histone deacetylase 14 [Thalassobium sp. R2A62]MDG1340765.1 histone deacetylase family protein [Paracoccaceae bacterium]